ncbi:hypothetical protein [Actinacidiphila soli]|uniref:hypothetical protein n=1 Tax=Actinacidiphila soli TaxID=2487275 RepID=UPI000FCACF79|nr:hypothetical protein [Actinacidiphila soli]
MRIHRTGRIDPDTAEKLLAGRPLGPDAGHAALTDLLAALAAPAADGEQPGEQAVLAAFREKRLSPVQPLGRSRMTVAAPARRLSAKALVAALATTAVCGVAFAAGTGYLPGLRGGNPSAGPGGGGSSASTTAGATGAAGTPGVADTGGPGSSPASADSAFTGLCRAYTTHSVAGRADLLTKSAYADLVEASGGADRVAAYCAAVLGTAGHGAHGSPSATAAASPGARKGSRSTHAARPSASPRSTRAATAPVHSTPTSHPTHAG